MSAKQRPSKAKAKSKRRSGTNLTDEQRAANGWGRITLRMPQQTIALLGVLADEAGLTRADYVHALTEEADRRHAELHAGRRK